MIGMAPPDPKYVATFRVQTQLETEQELTKAVYRVRCNQQPDR